MPVLHYMFIFTPVLSGIKLVLKKQVCIAVLYLLKSHNVVILKHYNSIFKNTFIIALQL